MTAITFKYVKGHIATMCHMVTFWSVVCTADSWWLVWPTLARLHLCRLEFCTGVGMGPNPRIPAGFPRERGWKICETRGNCGNGYNARGNTAGVGKTDANFPWVWYWKSDYIALTKAAALN